MLPSDRGIAILLVEDNPADVVLVREALREQNLEVELFVADDGEKAMDFIDRVDLHPDLPCPKLLVLDLNLPKRTGHEVLQRLRQSNRCAELPVVILSSSDAPKDREAASRLGADGYIRKPSSLDDFMKIGVVLKDVLEKADSRGGE